MAYNILVVDDSAIVRAIIKKTLSLAGVDVGELYQAGNGKEGLAVLDDKWVDLVLADINMPEMTGIEMVEKMSESGLMKTVPVVMISTEGSQTRVEELKAKGVRAYIRKPFTPELVKEVIDKILGDEDD
ncbi:response regulator [bacterium]|nr:response regulator [bacterium]